MNIIQKPSPNHYSGRAGFKPTMIVNHITDGHYPGCVDWMCNPVAEASAHFCVARNGDVVQLVGIENAAWGNGTSTSPSSSVFYGKSSLKEVVNNKTNANYFTVSIEHEGFDGSLTDVQAQKSVELTKFIISEVKRIYNVEIPIDREHIVGHYQINPITKPNCPGAKFPWGAHMNSLNPPNTDSMHPIYGEPKLTKNQFITWGRKQSTAPKLNCSFEELVDLYYQIGKEEGIRADYALCQAIHETNFFQYGNIVLAVQNNYAGLGATDSATVGSANTFASPLLGVTAHIQHLKAYATIDSLVLPCADVRYTFVHKGSAPYLEWLSIPNNPQNCGWASDANYYNKVMNYYNAVSLEDNGIMSIEKAVKILNDKGIINTPEYWMSNTIKEQLQINELIIKMANSLI